MSGVYSTVPNYGGRQPTNTSYIKQFTTTIGFLPFIFETINSVLNIVFTTSVIITSNLTVEGTFTNSSDRELKNNIEYLETSMLKNLKPCSFNFKKENEKKPHYGFIAQEVEEFFPELVGISKNNYKTVNYIEFIPLLLLEIQSLRKEIDELKQKSTINSISK